MYYGEEIGTSGMKGNDDKNVRKTMDWAEVENQQKAENSILNTYLTFTRLRNTYPALAEGTMTKHPVYNESNDKNYKSVAAWYMTKDHEKLLVIHNFGPSSVTLPLTENIEKAIAVQGKAQQNKGATEFTVKLEKYSSVVYKLAN